MHWARLSHATYGTRDSRCHDRDMPRRARSARPPRLYALLLFYLPRLLRLRLRFFLGGDHASATTTAVLSRFYFDAPAAATNSKSSCFSSRSTRTTFTVMGSASR